MPTYLFFMLGTYALVLFLWIYSLYNLFIYPSKRHNKLLAYEDSRLFLPFVVAELYCKDYNLLRFQKLGNFILYFILGLTNLITLFLSFSEDFTALSFRTDFIFRFPRISMSIFLSLTLYIISSRDRYRLASYYKNSAFYTQSAVAEKELLQSDSDGKGLRGEYYAWRLFQAIPEPKYILLNPIVNKPNGSFAEIDLVVLSKKGVFCIEAKNRIGTFLPPAEVRNLEEDWTQIQHKDDEHDMRVQTMTNPLKQNLHHIWTLSNFWHIDSKYFFNILCFGNDSQLNKTRLLQAVTNLNPQGSLLYFAQRHRLYHLVAKLPDKLGEDLIERLYKELQADCQMSRVRRESMIDARHEQIQQYKKQGKNRKLKSSSKSNKKSGKNKNNKAAKSHKNGNKSYNKSSKNFQNNGKNFKKNGKTATTNTAKHIKNSGNKK